MFDFIKENPFLWLIIFLLIVSPSFLFGAIQVVAIVVLVIFALVMVGLFALRWKVSKMQKDAQRGAQGTNYGAYSEQQRRATKSGKTPDVEVYTTTQGDKGVSKNVGDYVDFEEIKEEK